MPQSQQLVMLRLPFQEELTIRAEKCLRASGIWGQLPTPIEPLYRSAKIVERDMLELVAEPGFIRRLEHAEDSVRKAWQKLLGIADLRRRIVYVSKEIPVRRRRFTQFHEFSHQAIPWHNVHLRYKDRQHELSQEVRNEFEREANFMGSELLFQGSRFVRIARDYRASVDAIFQLADMHQASRHATAWRLAEVQDEKVAVAIYYPRERGFAVSSVSFMYWRYVPSNTFRARFPDTQFPRDLLPDHPWRESIRSNRPAFGEIKLDCGTDGDIPFAWESWWNSYALFVLVRQRSHLARLGKAIRF